MNCRFCNADPQYQSIKGNFVYGGSLDQKFWECAKCRMVYLYPPMPEEEEKKFYSQEFEKYMQKRSGIDTKNGWGSVEEHIRINQPEVIRRMALLEQFLNKDKEMKILEIGCSSGFMLLALRGKGHKVFGVEPSGGFVNFLKEKNIEVFSDFSQVKKSGIVFDLIIHYYVLEHIHKPLEFLKGYLSLIGTGARMIFEVPNVKDPLVSLYKVPAFDRFYWSVAHNWYFSPESMSYVLGKLNLRFNIHFQQRYDLSNHIVWMLEGKPGGKGRYVDIFSPELDERYKNDLIKSGVCDTMAIELIK